MSTLILVKTLEQLDHIERRHQDLLERARIVALSWRVWAALREQGRGVSLAAEYLDHDEIVSIPGDARRYSSSWYTGLDDELTYRGVNLGELVRIDNTAFFREFLAANAIARRLIERERPTHVVLFNDRIVPCIGSHRYTGRHDICEAAFAEVFAEAGIPVMDLSDRPRSTARWPFVPPWIKQRILKGFRSGRVRSIEESAPTDGSIAVDVNDAPWLLAIGEEIDLLSLSPIVDQLNAGGKFRATLMSTDRSLPLPTDRSGLSPLQNRVVAHLDQDGQQRVSLTVMRRLGRIRRLLGRRRRDQGDAGAFRASMGAAIQFEWMLTRAWPDAIRHIDRLSALFASARPAGVIVAGVERYRDRATVKIARAAGVPTIAIPHGFVGETWGFDYETDAFLAWGQGSKDLLIEQLGKRPDTIKVLGPVHLQGLLSNRNDDKQRRLRGRTGKILAITSRPSRVAYDAVDPQGFLDTWKEMLAFFDDRPDVELVIKAAPGGFDQVDWYAEVASRARHNNVRLVTGVRIEDLRDEVDAAVILFETTTAHFVCHALGLPTLFIRSSWRVMPDRVAALGLPNGFESIDRSREVRSALTRLVDDDGYRQQCRDRGERALAWQMFSPSPDAPTHVSDVVASCLPQSSVSVRTDSRACATA